MTTVIICGSRTWRHWAPIERVIRALPPGTRVLHGGARGADEMAAVIAHGRALTVEMYQAEWHQHGRGAGPRRNLMMLAQQPDRVIAFHDGTSPGTAHMIAAARQAGVPVEIHAPPSRTAF